MEKGRLEAFTDGVMAIIITIMVLELKPPHEANWHALAAEWPARHPAADDPFRNRADSTT